MFPHGLAVLPIDVIRVRRLEQGTPMRRSASCSRSAMVVLVLVIGCHGASTPTVPSPSPEAMDRFLSVIAPGTKVNEPELQAATAACFKIGATARAYEKVLQQAHAKDVFETSTVYWFYPGKARGEEGDLGVHVTVRVHPPVIVDYGCGILIR